MSLSTLPIRKTLAGLALLATGVIGGVAVSATIGGAEAAEPSGASSTTATDTDSDRHGSGETALTGDTLAKVKAAVLAKYAGAAFDRVETDNGGVYEAHIVTAAGDKLTVEVDKAFAVTGTETAGSRGDHGGGAGETALTGDTLTKVKTAVLAKYVGATFDRVETDNGGVYEAHIVTAAGDKLTVAVDKAFAVTGAE